VHLNLSALGKFIHQELSKHEPDLFQAILRDKSGCWYSQ